MISLDEFRGKRTIIVGEVNTGKTAYAADVIRGFAAEGGWDIAIIDMAPDRTRGVGGKLDRTGMEAARYLTTDIVPPRLTGGTEEEVLDLATRNARSIERILDHYETRPAHVLGINDVSMYLQAGKPDRLFALLDSTATVVMNGYFGCSLGGGTLGERERENMSRLMDLCDRVIRFQKAVGPASKEES